MPVYLDIWNLIISKKAISEKYNGGIEKFKMDYDIERSEIDQEDGELFSLGQMNVAEFDIERLLLEGLNFDEATQSSDDFTIVGRYENVYWEVDWLRHNGVFAWHIDTNIQEIEKLNEVSKMTMTEVSKLFEKGDNLLKTIWIKSS